MWSQHGENGELHGCVVLLFLIRLKCMHCTLVMKNNLEKKMKNENKQKRF